MKQLVFLLVVVAFACNEIRECDLDPNIEYAVIGFFNSTDSTEKEVIFKSLTINSDGPYSMDTASYFAFLLDPSDEAVTYYFETDSTLYDLAVNYRVDAVDLYSVDCGPSFKFNIESAESTSFDSVAVVGPILNKNILVNVEIYF